MELRDVHAAVVQSSQEHVHKNRDRNQQPFFLRTRPPPTGVEIPKISGTNFRAGDFAPPEPEFRAEFWETNFGRPNFGPEFRGRIFWLCFSPAKEAPSKIHLQKFTFQNSTQTSGQKIHIAPLQGHLAALRGPSEVSYPRLHEAEAVLAKRVLLIALS